ncbi:MAG TPA: STAS domain-containing protein [Streptosporangiaceae bacterium]|nr:STAS domain-containing protein [Streptosporangiaceae bacterium]
MDALELSSQRQGAVTIVAARGDLDIITSPQLDSCLTEARRATALVILDLSAVDFMDTSCLAVIVGHWKKLTVRGGTLALAGARYRYTKTLWITGLADRLPMFDDVSAALAACTADGAAQPGGPAPASAPETAAAGPAAGSPSGSGSSGPSQPGRAEPAGSGPPAAGPAGRPAGRPPGRAMRPR